MKIEKVMHHPEPPPMEPRYYITLNEEEARAIQNSLALYIQSNHSHKLQRLLTEFLGDANE